jgi:predicted RNase H-like HicB family nuclease
VDERLTPPDNKLGEERHPYQRVSGPPAVTRAVTFLLRSRLWKGVWNLGWCYTFAGREDRVKPKREFTVVIERDEDGYYVARVPELRGCYTQAKNLDTLMKRVREVIELCLEDGDSAESMELVGVQRIAV